MPKAKPGLTQRKIVGAAMRYVDRHGLERLSMRRLADELGVGTMSLYTYVPSKGALQDAIVGRLLSQVQLGTPDIDDWGSALGDLARGLRKTIRAHPNALPIVAKRLPLMPEALRLTEHSCAALRFAGFDEETAAHAHRLLTGYVIGYLALEIGGFFGASNREFVEWPVELELLMRFPRVTECARFVFSWDADAEFEAGLEIILSGLRSRLAVPG